MSLKPVTDDEFWALFRTINAFFYPWWWQETRASKDHVDEFGDTVSEGDFYFTRERQNGYGRRFKLSRKSMETLLVVFLDGNPLAKRISSVLQETPNPIRTPEAP